MKKVMLLISVLLILFGLPACAGKKSTETSAASADSVSVRGNGQTTVEEEAAESLSPEEAAVDETAKGAADAGGAGTGRKLIKRLYLELETKTFDKTIGEIGNQVTALGGYIESEDVSGNSYYYEDSKRYANIVCRVPVSAYEGFVQTMDSIANIVSKQESVEDITLQYVDVESHKKALQVEQERLFVLLEKAETMEDIIAIETRLSEVRYELQNYESTLKTYDNQIEYSTITLSVSEVERISDTKEEGFWQEIAGKFKTNVYNIGKGLKELAVWILSSLPYLLLIGIIALIIIWISKAVTRYADKKKIRGTTLKKEEENESREK